MMGSHRALGQARGESCELRDNIIDVVLPITSFLQMNTEIVFYWI